MMLRPASCKGMVNAEVDEQMAKQTAKVFMVNVFKGQRAMTQTWSWYDYDWRLHARHAREMQIFVVMKKWFYK